MAYRFTNTEKWQDSWFCSLSQIQMLLFIYLCDNCDIAGFIEVNYKRWASDINSSSETIEGACKGLARGLLFSKDQDCIYIKNFLKHQKNIPLNENNKAHIGILKRFNLYSHKFDIQDVNVFIEGACKGLLSPTGIGIGIGNEETTKLSSSDETIKNNEANEAVSVSDTVSVTDSDIKKKRNIFIIPTVEEIKKYCLERKNSINPDKFFNYYQSKGWVVGKTKMKDWKAAVRTWENNSENDIPEKKENKISEYEQMMKPGWERR